MEYLDIQSPLHRLNPLTKLIILACLFTLGMISSNLVFLVSIIIIIFFGFLVTKATALFGKYLKVFTYAGMFMLVLQLLFAHEGPELARFFPRNLPVLGWLGAINRDSLELGLVMAARMAVFGLSLPLLLATTQSRDLVMVMVDHLKFPYQYAFMFITALRFVPTLLGEIENIFQAQQARAFELKSKNPVKQFQAYLPLITPLVLIALKKAERLAMAMETRGFGLEKRTYLRKPVMKKSDYFTVAVFTGGVIVAIFLKYVKIL